MMEDHAMKIRCVWEHNGSDTLLYASDFPGAYTRGENLAVAAGKMSAEIRSYLAWLGCEVPDEVTVEIVQDAACSLNISDADSDVLFSSESEPLTMDEYVRLKQLVLKSAEDFHSLYEAIPDKNRSGAPERKTFYGQVPRTAEEMYVHTKSVNAYYFAEIGVDADNEGTILTCRQKGFELLEAATGFLKNPVIEGSYGEYWSLRKVLRRFLWHDRIHARAMYRMAVREFCADNIPDLFRFTYENETVRYCRCENDHAKRDQTIRELMGTMVHVIVDRPIGYQHGDIVYPVNYGYLPGIIAGDGEEQDAYILGVTEPLSSFDGRVVGAVRRKNDCEDKLIVAPDGIVFHQGEIAEAVHFQEKYFMSTIDSLLRKSCGVIPFRRSGRDTEYLIVLQSNGCWSFPKGHMDAGETEAETALRELREETGLEAELVSGLSTMIEYEVSPYAKKQVVLFLGEVRGDVIPQETEVVNYQWVGVSELEQFLYPDTYKACEKLLR